MLVVSERTEGHGEMHDEHSITSGTVFEGISRKAQKRLEALSAPVQMVEGYQLTRQGRRGDEFGVILDGEVDVVVDDEVVSSIGPGDHYGEVALLADRGTSVGQRSATLVARTTVTASVMSIKEFEAAMREFPELAERLESSRARALNITV